MTVWRIRGSYLHRGQDSIQIVRKQVSRRSDGGIDLRGPFHAASGHQRDDTLFAVDEPGGSTVAERRDHGAARSLDTDAMPCQESQRRQDLRVRCVPGVATALADRRQYRLASSRIADADRKRVGL